MKGEAWAPRADQRGVLDWLLPRERGLLVAPTGSGKTVVAGTWLVRKLFDEFAVGKVLIVAPKLVVPGWGEQFRRWEHLQLLEQERHELPFDLLDLTPSIGSDGKRGALTFRDKREAKRRLLAVPGRVHVCSWDAFPHIEAALGKSWPYGALVLDESSFIRDQGSARARAARRAVHKSGKVSHVLLMTATPNANHDVAVFPQVDLVAPGRLGPTLTAFRETYCVPDAQDWRSGQVYSWKIAGAMRERFEKAVAEVSLSVPECLGIDVLEVEHPITLPPAAREEYDTLARDQVLEVPLVTAASEAVLHNKLRQVATGFVYDDAGTAHGMHDAKLVELQRLVEGLGGRQALVVYEFDEELRRLRGLFGGGKSNACFADIRDRGARDRFMQGKLQLLGIHPKSAGHGLDMLQHASNTLIWCTATEDRELYDQTNGRLKRPGQDQPTVMVHVLVARDTVEERVWREVLPGKLARASRLLDATRAV